VLYETTIIIDGYLQEERQVDIVNRIETLIEKNGGNVIKTERMGKRRLAYEINKKQHGYYIYFLFEGNNPRVVDELEREFRFNEGILRYLTVKVHKASPQYKEFIRSQSDFSEQVSADASDNTEVEHEEAETENSQSEESVPVKPESSDDDKPKE
jgi:small subunit ribosomal protein S6